MGVTRGDGMGGGRGDETGEGRGRKQTSPSSLPSPKDFVLKQVVF